MWLKHSITFLLLIFWFDLISANYSSKRPLNKYLPTRRRKPVRVTNEDRFPSPRIVILGMYTTLKKSLPDPLCKVTKNPKKSYPPEILDLVKWFPKSPKT